MIAKQEHISDVGFAYAQALAEQHTAVSKGYQTCVYLVKTYL